MPRFRTRLTHASADRASFVQVNPFHRRRFNKSPYINHLRMSFGPAWPNLKMAVAGMTELVALAKRGDLPPLEFRGSTAAPLLSPEPKARR